MAIKISNSTIIDDSKNFINVQSCSGTYGDLHASPSSVTSNITLSNSIQTCIMTQAQTFTISGGDEGRTTALLLDTTSSHHRRDIVDRFKALVSTLALVVVTRVAVAKLSNLI